MRLNVSNLFGLGLVPRAPGTAGSLAAVAAAFVVNSVGDFALFVVAVFAACAIGLWSARSAKLETGKEDPPEFVMDEFAGQWIALLPVSFIYWNTAVGFHLVIAGAAASFALFRYFDIVKPGPVGWADRLEGSIGIMLDDLIAGALAAIVISLGFTGILMIAPA